MAHCLDDALPPHFLFNTFGFRHNPKAAARPHAFINGSRSCLTSPVDDEDQLLAKITRKLGLSSLDDGFYTALDSEVAHRILSAESARLRRISEQLYAPGTSRAGVDAVYDGHAQRSLFRQKSPVSDDGFNQNLLLSHHQLVANQIQQLKQRQAMLKQQQRLAAYWETNAKPIACSNHAARCRGRNPKSGVRPFFSSAGSEWPALQRQQNRPGTGVLLPSDRPTLKRECTGTGVFLPQPETRKKPGKLYPCPPRFKESKVGSLQDLDYCATALSDTVIRALNLNQENLGSQPQLPSHRFNGCLAPDNDCIWNTRKNSVPAPQSRATRLQQVPNNSEIRLPQEWTY